MKNNVIYSSLILLLIATVTGCNFKTEENGDSVSAEAPKQIVSIESAKEMYDSYTERRVRLIEKFEEDQSPNVEFDPTRQGWYDYDTLKQYMAYIEQQAKDANVDISGISIYFANYPEKLNSNGNIPPSYKHHNSIFLVPTMREDGNDHAFYISEDEKGNSKPQKIKERRKFLDMQDKMGVINKGSDRIATSNAKLLMLTSSLQDTVTRNNIEHSLILNEAHIIPPPKKESDMDF